MYVNISSFNAEFTHIYHRIKKQNQIFYCSEYQSPVYVYIPSELARKVENNNCAKASANMVQHNCDIYSFNLKCGY